MSEIPHKSSVTILPQWFWCWWRTHKRLKRMLFNWTIQDKMRIKFFFFLGGGLLFPSYLQHKNKQFTFARRCLQREEGMRHDLFLRTASIQLAKDQWTVCFCVVHSLEKEDFLKNVCILSCFVQLKSILSNLLCVSDLFSEHWQSTLFQVLTLRSVKFVQM